MELAGEFEAEILAQADEAQRLGYERFFPGRVGTPGVGDHWFAGVRMGTVFGLAKKYTDLDVSEFERLLDSPVHEVRVGALKAMALSAGSARTTTDRRADLVGLYLRRHDRIDEWDLVDLAAAPILEQGDRSEPPVDQDQRRRAGTSIVMSSSSRPLVSGILESTKKKLSKANNE